ncbi:TrbI/VirB10 family protein [Acidicapsa acidisoli]|uniref:TrbI/VirB10 family protein n=1 Tax=Acidicapsa acidisoli TaxID=1615681 RepID=UPI0021E00958|nr:TrbI/VirB10 family protein [Acidicapsa acidisoli]
MPEPELTVKAIDPKGVLQKNMKAFIFLGASALVIAAAMFSAGGKKSTTQAAAKGQPPQPTLQDNTDNNVQDLKNQLQAERQKQQQQAALAAAIGGDPALASATSAQQAAAAAYGQTGASLPCVPGQSCPQAQQANMQQVNPEQQQAQMIAAKERERADESRFASNLVYSRPSEQQQQQVPGQMMPAQYGPTGSRQAGSSLVPPRAPGEQQEVPEGYKRPLEANVDSATGQPYLVYEGSVLDTVLMNRLDGDAAGAVKVLVSNPLYSHDHQHVIIPEGTVVLGEAKKIGAAGFGQQRRIAVVFHRLIMPDGYSVDLDQFHGLDQIGEEGLKDKVNNHYLEIFGTSIALGVIAGAGEITEGGGTISTSGSQAFVTGAAGNPRTTPKRKWPSRPLPFLGRRGAIGEESFQISSFRASNKVATYRLRPGCSTDKLPDDPRCHERPAVYPTIRRRS